MAEAIWVARCSRIYSFTRTLSQLLRKSSKFPFSMNSCRVIEYLQQAQQHTLSHYITSIFIWTYCNNIVRRFSSTNTNQSNQTWMCHSFHNRCLFQEVFQGHSVLLQKNYNKLTNTNQYNFIKDRNTNNSYYFK